MLVMKLNAALTYILYFGIAIMLYPAKYTSNTIFNTKLENGKTIKCKAPAIAKAEVLHSDLLFKY